MLGTSRSAGVTSEAYVFFGSRNLSGTQNLGIDSKPDVTFQEVSANEFGGRVSGVGDVNSDGFADVMVRGAGAAASGNGAAFIFFGGINLGGKTIEQANAGVRSLGYDDFGTDVGGARNSVGR